MRGFTLLETLMTTAILAVGLVGVAALFSYSARANLNTRQRTTATILLYDKMEQFKSTPLDDSLWAGAGGSDEVPPYVRLWQITGTNPRRVTVIVVVENGGITGRPLELIRATTMVSH
ncbi:MAG TPA: prepilin-type N-terminal cleavage/methylation domain-containing protein [Terriglobia bacterium]|nr:prepilin-type N-terminal cleavage/methylation domain-containing protein [Terriglobia bacterium]